VQTVGFASDHFQETALRSSGLLEPLVTEARLSATGLSVKLMIGIGAGVVGVVVVAVVAACVLRKRRQVTREQSPMSDVECCASTGTVTVDETLVSYHDSMTPDTYGIDAFMPEPEMGSFRSVVELSLL
jgi:hypothetical protein